MVDDLRQSDDWPDAWRVRVQDTILRILKIDGVGNILKEILA